MKKIKTNNKRRNTKKNQKHNKKKADTQKKSGNRVVGNRRAVDSCVEFK